MQSVGVPSPPRLSAVFHAVPDGVHQAMLSQTGEFLHATLDALTQHICVLDETGVIIAVNSAWREFAAANGAAHQSAVEIGTDYLEICDRAAASGDRHAAMAGEAIRAITRGERDSFSLEYPCHSPDVARWFLMRVNRFPRGGPVRLVISHESITERRLAEEALQKNRSRLSFLMATAPAVIYAASPGTPYAATFISDNIQRQFGYSPAEFLACPGFWYELIHPEDRQRVMAGVVDKGLAYTSIEYRLRYRDGHYGWVRDECHLVQGADGKPGELVGYMIDVDEKKRYEERILRMAHYDELTQLPNRVLFQDRLHQSLAQAGRNGWPVGLLFINLDRFKVVNETLGHAAGDELLCQVSERLKNVVRADDTVGRLGGDEFVVILNRLNRPRDSGIVAEKIILAFSGAFTIDDREIFINPSIGITVYPDDAGSPDELVRNADAAMYHAKELGRNRYQYYTAAMKLHALERLDLESQLRRALEREEFVLHYQPKVDLKSREVVGFEALVRWQHPVRNLIQPGEFIPLLEETGLIVPVGEWALRAACDRLKQWKQRGYRCVPVSVNLSTRQLQQASLPYHVIAMLAATGVNPRLLELEITESSLMRNPEEAIRLLNIFKKKGIGISIDDFGTGYSSLGYLKRLPVNALKIDKSFVRDVISDPDDAAIVRTIINMAQQLGLGVIAEGVETEAQYRFLCDNGCSRAQGFLFGKPLEPQAAERLLKSRNS